MISAAVHPERAPHDRKRNFKAALVLACVALPAFAIDVRYLLSVRTDVRTRTPLPGDAPASVVGDFELLPRAELTLGERTQFALQYAPSLLLRDAYSSGRPLALHRGRLALSNRWQRATLLLSQDGAYGDADVGALRPAEEGQPTSVPGVQTVGVVKYLRSATLLSLEARPTDRFTLGMTGGFSVTGSTEQPAPGQRALLPLQYGPSGSVRARLGITRTDGLTTTAQVTAARFVTGQEQFVAQVLESWDRQVSRTLVLTVGAGAAITRERVVASPDFAAIIPGEYVEFLPVGQASLTWREELAGRPLRLDTSLRVAPFADRFTGLVYERVEARALSEWRFAREWIATASVGGAVAVPVGLSLVRPPPMDGTSAASAQDGDRLLFSEGTVTWTAQPWLLLQASARVLWTQQPRTGVPGLVQAAGTVSVTVRDQDSLAW